MSYLLRIEVSPRGARSHSRLFAEEVSACLLSRLGIDRVVRRDLSASPLPPIDGTYVDAVHRHTSRESSAGVPALALSEELIDELDAAGALVIATPVHNYTVPGTLKIWLDHVVRVGRTFKSTKAGKIGILHDRPTIIVSTSGGAFSAERATQPDFFAPYLDAILATVGIHSVHHLRLENLVRGEQAIAAAYTRARLALLALV